MQILVSIYNLALLCWRDIFSFFPWIQGFKILGAQNGTWHFRQRINPILTCGEGEAKTKGQIHGPFKSQINFQEVCLWSFQGMFEGLFEYMNAETESFGVGLHSHLVFDLVHLSYICIEMCHKYSHFLRPVGMA